ncbi:MAG: N-acetyltransferase, partial [Planctomycetes bacterium]|nr:N-acetyltransferase [Planctomycetota bacterium]
MEIRQARMPDASAICEIVNYHAELGRMLHRSMEAVYERLRDFLVADNDGQILGCAAVEIAWANLAEIKSLAVRPEHTGEGIGRKLVAAAVADAKQLGLKRLFALTYEQAFFARYGFRVIDKNELPSKVW